MENKIEKRESRSYKAKNTPYNKSMRRAWKDKTTLAEMLEKVVNYYSKGFDIYSIDPHGNKQLLNSDIEIISAKIKSKK